MHNAGLASKMVDQHKTSIDSTYFGHQESLYGKSSNLVLAEKVCGKSLSQCAVSIEKVSVWRPDQNEILANDGLMLANCPFYGPTSTQHWLNISCLLGIGWSTSRVHWAGMASYWRHRQPSTAVYEANSLPYMGTVVCW